MRHGRVHASWFCRAGYLGMALLLLSSCTLGATSQRGPLPPSRQVLQLGLNSYLQDEVVLDPAHAYLSDEGFLTALIFPPLLTVNNRLNLEPWAATTMPTFDPATNTYTFTIRPGLRWSDDTPIDADTYAYSLNRSLSPCTHSESAYFFFPIKDAQAFSAETCSSDGQTAKGEIQTLIGDSLRVPNNRTLVIQLNAPAPYLLSALTTPAAFAEPQQLIDRYGSENWTQHLTQDGGFGGNLYRVKSSSQENGYGSVNLVACLSRCGSPSGWGTHQVAPPLREIDVHFYPDFLFERMDYQTGALDAEALPSAADRVSGSTFIQIPTLQLTWLQPNWDDPPFTDLRARQAFALALDKDTLAKMLGDIPTNHIVPEGSPGYDPGLLGPDETTSTTGNVTAARRLLQSYADDACHGQFRQCPQVTVYTSVNGACAGGVDPSTLAYESKAIAMWRQAFPGYPIRGPFAGGASCPLQYVYDIVVPQAYSAGWIADYPDPQDWLSLQFGPESPYNPASVDVPAADALMAQADQTLDPTERAALYNQAEQLLVFNVASIPIGQTLAYYSVRSTVSGFALAELGYPSLDQWYSIQMMNK